MRGRPREVATNASGEGDAADGFDLHQLTGGRLSKATATALQLRQGLPFDVWERVGRQVRVLADASAWWVGDWLVYGARAYPERYRRAAKATGLDYKTLRNYSWVASRIPATRRRENISFGHHAEVASLSEEEQETWLLRVKVHGWSRGELRRQMRAERDGQTESDCQLVALAISVDPGRHDLWRRAAGVRGYQLQEWVAESLDRAAASILRDRPAAAVTSAIELDGHAA